MKKIMNSITWFYSIFIITGLIFIIIGLSLLCTRFTSKNDYASIGAVVTNTRTYYDFGSAEDDAVEVTDVYVKYSVGGKSYDAILNNYHPNMKIGDIVDVRYRISDPSRLQHNASYFAIILILAFGSSIMSVGIVPILKQYKNNELLRKGILVRATINNITLNTSVSTDGSFPYKINFTFRHPTNSRIYTFTSENIWADLSKKMNMKEMNVYIDPQNPNNYYIDIEPFLKHL